METKLIVLKNAISQALEDKVKADATIERLEEKLAYCLQDKHCTKYAETKVVREGVELTYSRIKIKIYEYRLECFLLYTNKKVKKGNRMKRLEEIEKAFIDYPRSINARLQNTKSDKQIACVLHYEVDLFKAIEHGLNLKID